MTLYLIEIYEQSIAGIKKQSGNKVQSLELSVTSEVDEQFLLNAFGLRFGALDIEYFKAHIVIWNDWFSEKQDGFCLVIDANLVLEAASSEWEDFIGSIPSDIDIVFPFDKSTSNGWLPMEPSKYGYYWGAHFYLLNSNGAGKLLKNAKIRQPVDEEILSLISEGQIRGIQVDVGGYKFSEEESAIYQSRLGILKDAIFGHPAWSSENRALARKLIFELTTLAARAGVRLVLHGGTLLGSVRHNEIMPWDDDIDFGIDANDIEALLIALGGSEKLSFVEWIGEFRGQRSIYYKVWLKDFGEVISGMPYKFPFVDIWLYFYEGKYLYYKEWPKFDREMYLPLRQVEFEGSYLFKPFDSLKFLDFLFSNWRTHIDVYPYSHRTEIATIGKLSLRISVDTCTGRLLQ